MFNLSGELTVILITIWWLQKLERLPVSEEESQNFDVERFKPSKLSELKVRKQYHIKTSNSFAASENLNDSEDINRPSENI
jgi:hypothetical protein